MKNPNTKYLLVALVLFVWGLVIYRFAGSLNDQSPPSPVVNNPEMLLADTAMSYSLISEDGNDPFHNMFEEVIEDTTDTDMNSHAGSATSGNIEPVGLITARPVEQPPAIAYKGYIYNPHTGKRTALISYNGKPMSVGVSDQIDQKIKVLSINEQHLVVGISGKRFTIGLGG